jgi:hypothetical protein
MTSDWFGGAFTALGAVIGAGATLLAGLIGNRAQRGLAEANHKAQIVEARREAYAAYLTAVYDFMDGVRELIAKLEGNAEVDECDAARRAYLKDWDRLQPRYAPVLIVGPSHIEEHAERLRFCLGDLADKCDEWYTSRNNNRRFRGVNKVNDAQQAARDARSEFASAVRDHVYG